MRTSKFDALNEEIITEVRKVYSEKTIDHAMNPRNVGEMIDADGYGRAVRHCGDEIEIWLKIRNGKISKASFWTNGCSTSIASASIATELITGRMIAEAQKITQSEILAALDGLPEASQHCAQLAANAVKNAIKDYLTLKREPWKKAFRKR